MGDSGALAHEDDPTRAWLLRLGAELRARNPRGVVWLSPGFVGPGFAVTTAETLELVRGAESGSLPEGSRPRGSVSLARKIIESLLFAKLKATADPARGLDAGVWQPLSLLFPEAAVPVVQISLHASLEPDLHFALGRALEPLRDEGYLIVGSGSVTRDGADRERATRGPAGPEGLGERSRRFESWVTDLLTRSAPYARARGLTRFRDHPDARAVQADGEHLLPLIVVAGAASKDTASGNEVALAHAGSQRGSSTAAFSFGL